MNRYKAFAIHFATSLIIVSAILALMLFIWYPAPYFEADGAQQLVILIAGVDIVLGPLLTLIIFKPGKPGLKFDLTLIALVQISALAYGASVVYTERPSYVVYAVDMFKLVPAGSIDSDDLPSDDMRSGVFSRPKLIFARLPEDPQERSDLLLKSMDTGKDLEMLPEYYEPYANNIALVLERARPLELLQQSSVEAAQAVKDFLKAGGRSIHQFVFVPLIGKNRDLALVLDATTGLPSGSVSINPFIREP
ncbi:MAG: TfpX/TfpZ family type IV pilin accessory protein [Thiogranum sp.]|nr:TfpX/TfpZ family type IV pilin accessory protein [Thiogranum sp.]